MAKVISDMPDEPVLHLIHLLEKKASRLVSIGYHGNLEVLDRCEKLRQWVMFCLMPYYYRKEIFLEERYHFGM